MQEIEIRTFLLQTADRLESHRHFLTSYSEELAPLFNVFDFILPDENRLSDIIAFLLDPKERGGQGDAFHGQRDTFLKLFLKMVGLENRFDYSKPINVHREEPTDECRRIDIVLDQQDFFGLGIENK